MKKISPYYFCLGLLVLVYITILFLGPPNASYARYSLTPSAARMVSLIVILPYIAIWFTAFYGFIKVKQYASLINDTKDGKALNTIGNGLMVVALYLPFTALASLIRSYVVSQDSSLHASTTIIYNYLALGLVLIGFFLINKGARHLSATVKKVTNSLNLRVGGAIFLGFCGIFSYVTLSNPARQFPTDSSRIAAYALPDWLVALTIVLPYIIVWYLGYKAAYHIDLYRRNVSGSIYQKALGLLSGGVAAIVGAIMLIRTFTSVAGFFDDLELRILLLVVYLLLIIISIGFVLVALGAKKLKKIEEV